MADIITADIAAIVFISAASALARMPLGLSDLKWLNELQQQLAF